jgi:hypothetical protein
MDLEREIRFLLKALKGEKECCQNDCCEEDDEEDEVDEEADTLEELNEKYMNFIKWVFGEKKGKLSTQKNKKIWNELHADLPMPKIFSIERNMPIEVRIIFLLIEAYPFYLKEKKLDCKI